METEMVSTPFLLFVMPILATEPQIVPEAFSPGTSIGYLPTAQHAAVFGAVRVRDVTFDCEVDLEADTDLAVQQPFFTQPHACVHLPAFEAQQDLSAAQHLATVQQLPHLPPGAQHEGVSPAKADALTKQAATLAATAIHLLRFIEFS